MAMAKILLLLFMVVCSAQENGEVRVGSSRFAQKEGEIQGSRDERMEGSGSDSQVSQDSGEEDEGSCEDSWSDLAELRDEVHSSVWDNPMPTAFPGNPSGKKISKMMLSFEKTKCEELYNEEEVGREEMMAWDRLHRQGEEPRFALGSRADRAYRLHRNYVLGSARHLFPPYRFDEYVPLPRFRFEAPIQYKDMRRNHAQVKRVKESFKRRNGGGKADTAIANVLDRESGPKLKEHMLYCVTHPDEMNKIAKIKSQVAKALDRGEKIELLVDKSYNKFTYTCDRHTFNYLVEDGFTYMVVADEDFGRQIPFAFLKLVKDFKRPDTPITNGLDKEFGPKLKEEHMLYCVTHPDEMNKIAKVRNQVAEVKGIMMENIEKVPYQGEKIKQLLVFKTCASRLTTSDSICTGKCFGSFKFKFWTEARRSNCWLTRLTTCAPRLTTSDSKGETCAGKCGCKR